MLLHLLNTILQDENVYSSIPRAIKDNLGSF